jgi:oligoendopeptidase F
MENLKFEQYPLTVPSLKKIEKKITSLIDELKSCGSAATALPVIKKMNKFMDEISSDMTIISVRYHIDTQNQKYKNAQNKLDEISPVISAYLNNWNKLLVKVKYRKDLEKVLGKYYFQMIETSLKVFDEKIVPELIEQNRLTSEYSSIMASAQIEFDGQVLNLPQMGKYTQHKDRDIRKKAAIAVDKWLGENEAKIGQIYDNLVKIRHSMAKKLGFKNYVELGYLSLGRLIIKPKT